MLAAAAMALASAVSAVVLIEGKKPKEGTIDESAEDLAA